MLHRMAMNYGALTPILWTLLALVGLIGVIALIHPRMFAAMARVGGSWVDTSKVLAKLDHRIDVDARVLPYSRYLGAAVVASVSALAFVLARR